MRDGLKRRWQRATQLSYLSPFERRLNRSLWALACVALSYCIAQHVLLANIPEAFRGGERLGSVGFHLANGYVEAFIFYLLVVRLPLRRDRQNIYKNLEPLIARVVAEATSLMGTLHQAAGFDSHRENSLANVQETCSKIGPETPTNMLIASTSPAAHAPVFDAIRYHMDRARRVNREILDLSAFVASEVICLVNDIESHGYFEAFEFVYPLFKANQLGKSDLSILSRHIFDYLLVVDRLDAYRREFLPEPSPRPAYLISGSMRDSDEVPLRHFWTPERGGGGIRMPKRPGEGHRASQAAKV
ncbi:hypothetical protein KXD96_18795 [Mycobacterium sp. SMC-2]|uniref:hypothetical protein n=1 Tax=Mycobacterium sp. SMC-2 TaxID=2857058 RepID=UPI0021B33613|nr:hypothetical protein [Mycobacterium sp. SMC-2]UXA05013.1 hypothetical protein KXD96_18795 [Mycobacterium sp. SMC-2]